MIPNVYGHLIGDWNTTMDIYKGLKDDNVEFFFSFFALYSSIELITAWLLLLLLLLFLLIKISLISNIFN